MTQSSTSTDKFHNSGRSVSEEKLMVAVRVRPLRADEGPRIVHVVSDKMLVLEEEADVRRDVLRQRRINDKHYVYDRVFSEDSTQEDVYNAICAPLVSDTLHGIAGAVFAYGATGAGKTHTMTGLMSRALSHLFSSIAESDEPDSYEVLFPDCKTYLSLIPGLLILTRMQKYVKLLLQASVQVLHEQICSKLKSRSPETISRYAHFGRMIYKLNRTIHCFLKLFQQENTFT